MATIYLKIPEGFKRRREDYISRRIEAILIKNGAEDADVSGNKKDNYTITNIPNAATEHVLSDMDQEPIFEPHLHPEE